jgi:peroxiredoxin
MAAALIAVAAASCSRGPDLAGRWDATVVVNDVEIPCAFEVRQTDAGLQGVFFNGTLEIASTGTTVEDTGVTFDFDQYGTKLKVTPSDTGLDGEYDRGRGQPYPFHAVHARETAADAAGAPKIDGVWIVKARGSKNEQAWRFIVDQKGADVEAAILRVDGDTGALTGAYDGGKFVLGHFDGSRPLLMEVTANGDGTLTLVENHRNESTAVREGTPAAAAIGAPEDPTYHTTLKDPSEPFRFAFADLDGKTVSNTDEKFKGKVLLVSVSGSWCPNCHDETPFHEELYREYRDRGFEVVSLSFERADQPPTYPQLRAFIKTYGIDYTVLVPGEPAQASELLPQTVNLDCFPTSFLIGRDGLVRVVHAGFPSPGSGAIYDATKREIKETIERLLDEPAGAAPSASAANATPSLRPAVIVTPSAAATAKAGATAHLSVAVSMPAAIHVQANKPRDPALIPTTLDVRAPKGVTVEKVTYPSPKEFTQAGSKDPLLVYGPEFTVQVDVRVAADTAAGTLDVPAVLSYQACDERVCFAPARAPATLKLTVE